ncbi:MAG: InlB B-repeat-containing protein, partial [Bacillota bacterium]
MRKIILFCFFIILAPAILKSQNLTVTAPTISAIPGDTVSIPINIFNFNNVGSFLIKFQYDTTVLQAYGQPELNKAIPGAAVSDSSGTVKMQWTGQNALSLPDGALLNLKFIYKGNSTQITFITAENVFKDTLGNNLAATYTNGSVSLKNYILNINQSGNGAGKVRINNILYTLPYTGVFHGNENVLLNIEAVPDPGTTFAGWTGSVNANTNPVTIMMNSDKVLTVQYNSVGTSQLTLTKAGSGSGQVIVNGILSNFPYTGSFTKGSQVDLQAVAQNKSSFVNWAGDLSSTANPVNMVVNGNKAVIANFKAVQYQVTINKTGNGQIKVNDTLRTLPFTKLYDNGTILKIEAIPDSGNTFSAWSGSLSSVVNPISVIVDTTKNINAAFKLKQFTISVNKSGTGNGEIKVNGSIRQLPYNGIFNYGSNVTIEAVAASGSIFTGWSGAVSGITNPVGVTVKGDMTISAGFNSLPLYSLTISKFGNGQVKINDTLQTLPFNHSYPEGSQVKIEAAADPGNTFNGWTGSFAGVQNPVVITMNGNKNLQANFNEIQYTLSISKGGAGNGQVKINGILQNLPYSGIFNSGTPITFEAVPDSGSLFSSWSGEITGNFANGVIVINKNITASANFSIKQYTLTISKSAIGLGTVKINGVTQALPYTGNFNYKTNVTIEAVPGLNSTFSSWSGDITGVNNPVVITLNGDKNITVNFGIIQYRLTVNKGGSGQIKINGAIVTLPYTKLFDAGSEVIVEAVPDSNNQFAGWSGDLTGNSNPSTIKIDKDKVITALFDLNILSLILNKGGDGTGEVKVNGVTLSLPYAATFKFGTQVVVEAIASPGSTFSGWSGDLTGTNNPSTIIINSNKTLAINFSIIKYTLAINQGGNGTGQIKVNGVIKNLPYSDIFNSGKSVTLEAIPAEGTSFTRWEGDLTGNGNPNSIIIDRNKSITSYFNVNAPDIPLLSYPGNNYKYVNLTPELRWSSVAHAVSYHFQLSEDSSFSRIIQNDSNITVTSIKINSLRYKTKYFWRIRSKNPGGYSSFSVPWSFTTRIEQIGCPTNLRSVVNGKKIELTWEDNSTNETGFQI